MDTGFEAKLIECLDALERGESVAQILARYPQEANQLRPILKTAHQLSELKLAPSVSAKRASKNEFLAEARQIRQSAQIGQRAGTVFRSLNRLLATVAFLLVIGIVGVASLSNSALPGEGLYGMKMALEQVRLSLARDLQTVQALNEMFEAERLAEVQRLLAEGAEIEVVFGDDILLLGDKQWGLVSGVQLVLDEKTVVVGKPEVGEYVHIVGKTTNAGTVLASLLQIEADHGNTHPDPVVTPTNDPTITSTPTSSPEPAFTPSPSPTMFSATTVPTPQPNTFPTPTTSSIFSSPTPSFTATPDQDNSGSGSGDDGSDDNSGSGSGDDSSDDNSGSGSGDDGSDDNSGSGSGGDDSSDDNSGSGSGGDNSGSGSGDDSDNSGSGGGGDDNGEEDDSGGLFMNYPQKVANKRGFFNNF